MLFNTLTRKYEEFTAERKQVKMYACGPSIYLLPHIGNYRTFLFEDLLQRYLEYLGYNVTRLLTLTDVEDKAIAEAEKEHKPLGELTRRNADVFFSDMKLLKIERPTYIPRSSTTVDQAAELIKLLLKEGYAYWHNQAGRCNAYFDPSKFRNFGKLSKLDVAIWPSKRRRFHKDTYPGTPWNKGDFILWHGYRKGDTVFWETEIGKGRPAWNVQDAAMVTKNMGFEIDLACGGVDNLVRHHDYTIAVVEAISKNSFSRYWLHGEHLFVDGKKMSKSKGNVYYPRDLVKMGYSAEHIRFFLVYKHYRRKLNFTIKNIEKTSQKLNTFRKMISDLQETRARQSVSWARQLVRNTIPTFERNMNNDLDAKNAFDRLFETLTELDAFRRSRQLGATSARATLRNLRRIDSVFQVLF